MQNLVVFFCLFLINTAGFTNGLSDGRIVFADKRDPEKVIKTMREFGVVVSISMVIIKNGKVSKRIDRLACNTNCSYPSLHPLIRDKIVYNSALGGYWWSPTYWVPEKKIICWDPAAREPDRTLFEEEAYNPVWSPDGKQIAFIKLIEELPDEPNLYSLCLLNWQGIEYGPGYNRPAQLKRIKEISNARPGRISWSPDGKQIAFQRGSSDDPFGQVWIVNLSDRKARRLTKEVSSDPAFSSDGQRIAYSIPEWDESEESAIWIHDLKTGLRRKITIGYYPTWSPDGRQIAFERTGPDIWVINADGSSPRLIIKEASEPEWRK